MTRGAAFGPPLPGRLAGLANRVGVDEHGEIYGALHDRIPMVTPEEQGAVQEEIGRASCRERV